MTNKEITANMTNDLGEILDFVNEYDYTIHEKDWGIGVFVNGIKVEWNIPGKCIKLGYGNDKEHDLPMIHEWLEEEGYEVKITKGGLSKICFGPTVQDFKDVFEMVEQHELDLINLQGISSSKVAIGVNFEGSNFSNAHERMTTIGGRFMKMVCEASGMSMNYDSEWPTKDDGRIDAVELDENNNPISIYECQSGIQNGNFLDTEHFSKALLRYPLDCGIIPTLKKIVILAGGYSEDHLFKIREMAEMFVNRENPIEVVLLQTTRNENTIGVELVNYKLKN